LLIICFAFIEKKKVLASIVKQQAAIIISIAAETHKKQMYATQHTASMIKTTSTAANILIEILEFSSSSIKVCGFFKAET
jgi:hypothetical protein